MEETLRNVSADQSVLKDDHECFVFPSLPFTFVFFGASQFSNLLNLASDQA